MPYRYLCYPSYTVFSEHDCYTQESHTPIGLLCKTITHATLRGNSSGKLPNFRKFVYFQILLKYTCIYCLLSLCKRSNRKSNSNDAIFFDLNLYFMAILTAVLFSIRRSHKIAKSPVLRIGGSDTQNLDKGMI